MDPVISACNAVAAFATALALVTVPAACGLESDSGASAGSKPSADRGQFSTAPRRGKQRGSLTMLPQLAGQGTSPKSAAAAKNVVVANFRPGVKGRAVALQRRQGGSWRTVGKARQSRGGVVQFAAANRFRGQPVVYRARAFGGERPASATQAVSTAVHAPSFSDEFNGTDLSKDWATRAQGYSAASQRRCSEADNRAVAVSQGTLRLQVRRHPERAGTCRVEGRDHSYRINGHVGTQGVREFRYGYFAARIKFQPRRGQHGSFWLQSGVGGDGPASEAGAEIDVIEWFGNNQPHGGLTSFVYADGNKFGGFVKRPSRFGQDWASKFHVFSVQWTPHRYIFRIDGKQTFATSRGVSHVPEYLILSLLSSDYELKYLGGERRLPQTMHVDWVRHWPL